MKPETQFKLDEQVAIVTGGAGGIGRVVARGVNGQIIGIDGMDDSALTWTLTEDKESKPVSIR